MRLQINISCDNSAFDDGNCGEEIARILYKFCGVIESYGTDDVWAMPAQALRDINGNTVGQAHVVKS
jgi:hypothetical protein